MTTSTIQIDGVSFDIASEHFAFPLFHVIRDMAELAKLRGFSRLSSATFSGTNLDDRGLQHVAAVSSIENLNLQETKISNAGLAQLARLPRLKYLRLKDNRQLTNDCIPHVLQLHELVDLQIHETAIDQVGVSQLASLTRLQNLCLDVWDGNFSLDALIDISARMPQCTILVKGRGEVCGGVFRGTWDRSS